jgi:hypothetical protein
MESSGVYTMFSAEIQTPLGFQLTRVIRVIRG